MKSNRKVCSADSVILGMKNGALQLCKNLWQPLVAILFGLLIGALVILWYGENPFFVYGQMFEKSFFSTYYLLTTLTRATTIIMCALATAMAWRSGCLNLGIEGQMVVGALVMTVCAIYIPGNPTVVMYLSIIIGMIAGGLFALLPALMNTKLKVSMVISTLMLNYVAKNIVSYFVVFPLRDRAGDGLALQTVQIPEGMHTWNLVPGTTFNKAFILAIVLTILYYWMTKYTVFGYETRISGLNHNFAKYGGIKGEQILILTMVISGMIGTLASTNEVFGYKLRYVDGMLTSTSYAWTGLMAAVIAKFNPLGMVVVSIFVAGLQIGGQAIQRTVGLPLEIATVIQACITMFVSVNIVIKYVKKSKPKAKEEKQEEKEAETT